MKVVFAAILALSGFLLQAAEYQLVLPATGDFETPVFFIDFSQFKVQGGSLKLKTSGGKEIPFSLDYQYGPVKAADRFYYAEVNGYHSHIEAPASEKKLSRLGYLSFRAEPGIWEYILSFAAGSEEIKAAPNPAVRCWWIECMRDPLLRKPFGAPDFFYENSAQAELMETVGWKLCKPGGTVSILPNAYQFTDAVRGRRVTQYFLAEMDGDTAIVASVPLTNAINSKWPVVTGYAGLRKGVLSEVWQEGIHDGSSESIWFNEGRRCKGSFWVVEKVTGRIYEIHVQSPPQEEVVEVRVNNSLLNIGDTLHVEILNLGREVLQPMQFKLTDPAGRIREISGARQDIWKEAELQITLCDQNGRQMIATTGSSLFLDNIPAGDYVVNLCLFSLRKEREVILQKNASLMLQNGPRW